MASAITAVRTSIAALRIGTGFLFLWAFLDKTFGWNYSTPSANAWIHGGSPTRGFLTGVSAGPFTSMFHSWASQGWADWMFMLALLGIGLAQHATGGALTGSTNPLVDEHVMDALALIVVGVGGTASRLGLGAMWAKLPFVQRHRALL